MSEKIEQLLFPGFEEKKTKTPLEILESKVNLHFHEIKLIRECLLSQEKKIKELEAAYSDLYMKKTP